MTYQQMLRELRGSRSRSEIAAGARVNLSTLVKAESPNRPVKFKTVAEIVRALGHADDSPEMRQIALLWLESVSGVRFRPDDAYREFKRILAREKQNYGEMLDTLSHAVVNNSLNPTQVALLTWAATESTALELLANARFLAERPRSG